MIKFYRSLISILQQVELKNSVIALLLLAGLVSSTIANAQNKQVTGTVTDAISGESVPGANILIKGTTSGVVSDFDGNYTISVSNTDVLVVSFIGYKTIEIPVGTRSIINVALEENIATLSEIIVIGYGAVEEKDVTGVLTKIGEEDFNKGIITSPERLLTGKVAGVSVVSNGGEPGGGSAIRIRGGTSLGASSDPLIVIDGVAMDNGGVAGGRNPLNFVNPSDIASITVLKDASAGAIYGSRAANGVIIITTKSGQPGKIKVNYDAFVSMSTFLNDPDFLTPDEFRAAINAKAPDKYATLGNESTVWLDEVLQNALGMKQMISISGGNEQHKLYGSANYLDNRGVINTDRNQNVNVSLRYNGSLLNDNLTLTSNLKYGTFNERFAPNVIGAALMFDPTRPVYNQDGSYFEWTSNSLAVGNPVATINETQNYGQSFRFLGNFEAEYKLPIEGLSIKGHVALDKRSGISENLVSANTKGTVNNGGYYGLYADERESKTLETYMMYKKEIDNHKFDFLGGYSYQESIGKYDGISANELDAGFERGLIDPTTDNLTSSTSELANYGTLQFDKLYEEIPNRLISFFGRVNYSYNDKYLFTFNVRQDGSSRFSAANRWGLFPSAAFGWRVMDEPFAAALSTVFSDLKFRASYGVTGNQDFADFQYLALYEYGSPEASYQFGNQYYLTLRPNSFNPDVKWESTASLNIGIDYGILDGRINGSFEVYNKYTSDLLFSIALPAGSLPFDRAITNIGEMRNRGIELIANTVVTDKTDFKLDLSFNISYNQNEIMKLDNSNLPEFPGYETGGISGDVGQTIQILKVGGARSAFRTYKQKYDENGVPIRGTNFEMYEDINEDGMINQLDRVIDRSADPSIIAGLTANASFKKFDASVTFRGNFGNYVYNNVSSSNGQFQQLGLPVTNNIHASAFETNFNVKQLYSDYYLENGSFVKLDNITVGYNGTFDKYRFRVYTTAQNVLTLTGYSGVDPEIFGGIDNNIYPRALTTILGVNINF